MRVEELDHRFGVLAKRVKADEATRIAVLDPVQFLVITRVQIVGCLNVFPNVFGVERDKKRRRQGCALQGLRNSQADIITSSV